MTDPKSNPSLEKEGIRVVLAGILRDIVLNHERPYLRPALDKDVSVILKRFDTRGIYFLAVELPSLGKALDSALVSGKFVIPPQFSRMGYTALPKLLFVLWSKVFDLEGRLRPEPSISAIVDIRFLTKAFYKYETDYDEATVVNTVEQFVKVDRELPTSLPKRGPLFAVLEVARTLITEVLGTPPNFFIPQHSSGAVATSQKQWDKTRGLKYHPKYRILGGFSNFYVNPRESYYLNAPVSRFWSGSDTIAKLVDVPKDSRGPRLICEEPVTQQFLQQGIKNEMYKRIENHPLTMGYVNFTDQTINQKLALIGSSVERDTVTLDMKEASDRVGYPLIKALFPEQWFLLFESTRTNLVELPKGKLIKLRKYAPMGSALCFPLESLVHWALCCAVYMLKGFSSDAVLQSVYVYGDDIVLRGLPPGDLFKIFPYFGLKFNEAKCCCKGEFRESCGVDAFKGVDVTTVKFKKCIPVSSGVPELLVAWVDYSNLAFERGYYSTSNVIKNWVDRWERFPYTRPCSDVVGFTSQRPYGTRPFLGLAQHNRVSIASAIDDRSPLYRCKSVVPQRPGSGLVDDRSRYFETILKLARRSERIIVEDSPVEYAIKHSVKFKKVWSKSVVAF